MTRLLRRLRPAVDLACDLVALTRYACPALTRDDGTPTERQTRP